MRSFINNLSYYIFIAKLNFLRPYLAQKLRPKALAWALALWLALQVEIPRI